MTLQNVTVIIPAHNRPERLRRLLDYYSRTDIKILVPDSSDHPFADAEKYPDITYLHRPKPVSYTHLTLPTILRV